MPLETLKCVEPVKEDCAVDTENLSLTSFSWTRKIYYDFHKNGGVGWVKIGADLTDHFNSFPNSSKKKADFLLYCFSVLSEILSIRDGLCWRVCEEKIHSIVADKVLEFPSETSVELYLRRHRRNRPESSERSNVPIVILMRKVEFGFFSFKKDHENKILKGHWNTSLLKCVDC